MSFKIDKPTLKFAVDLCAKTIAQRQQEEFVYRAIRVVTFAQEAQHYVAFSSNGGFNAVETTGFPISDFSGDEIDVLVECNLLLEIVSKSTVDDLVFSLDDTKENLLIQANGMNKLRCHIGETIAEFAQYDNTKKIGSMKVAEFLKFCRLVTPFSTTDIHKAPLIGLCINNNNLYASDEFKSNTILDIGLNIPEILNFHPIAADIIKVFADGSDVDFYLGKISSAIDFSHLVMNVNGIDVYILKYQTKFPTDTMDMVNTTCLESNTGTISINKSQARLVLSRISVFLDDNDLLAITAEDEKGVYMEVINAKTNEESKELIPGTAHLIEDLYGKKIYTSFANFQVMLDTLDGENITLQIADDPKFISVHGEKNVCWIGTKEVE